jgi:DNA-binding GntR family transcriptional regulator
MTHPVSSGLQLRLSSLSDQVYEHLRIAIIRAELKAGEKLVELDIAAQMGTSQGPVREALQRLERDGFVERRARSATFVTHISTEEMYELFSIRTVIEGFAIQRTTQKITTAQCTELDELIQKMAHAGLLRGWTPLSSQIERFIVESHPLYYPDFVEVGTRHQPIVDALRLRDGNGAARLLQEHIMLIWSKIIPLVVP